MLPHVQLRSVASARKKDMRKHVPPNVRDRALRKLRLHRSAAKISGMPDNALVSDPLWYKDAIIYELHVKTFQDSTGDGMGDFRGLISRLDYLQELAASSSPWTNRPSPCATKLPAPATTRQSSAKRLPENPNRHHRRPARRHRNDQRPAPNYPLDIGRPNPHTLCLIRPEKKEAVGTVSSHSNEPRRSKRG